MPLFPVVTPIDVSDLSREATQLEVAEKSLWVPGVDSVFWPCVSGEDEPPTFGGTAAYSSGAGLSVVVSNDAADTITWPGKPRAREDRPVMRIRFLERASAQGAIGESRNFRYGLTGNPSVWLEIDDGSPSPDKRITLETEDATGQIETTALLVVGPDDTDWHAWEIRLLDDRVELFYDGDLVLTHAVRFWPSSAGASSYGLQYFAEAGTVQGTLSQLSVQWEKEAWLA